MRKKSNRSQKKRRYILIAFILSFILLGVYVSFLLSGFFGESKLQNSPRSNKLISAEPIIVIGGPSHVTSLPFPGKAFVYSADNGNFLWDVSEEVADSGFGISVSASDFNGDSYQDIVVGAHGHQEPGSINNKGKIYVYSGAPPHNLLWSKKGFIAGNNLPPSLYNQYPEKYVEFGKGISSIPDTNGDGFEDILVEDPSYSPGGGILPGNHSHPPDSSGRVNLYSGIDGRLLWFGVGPNETHAYATDSSGIPDLNGDGFGDFVISGFGADNHRGKIYVYSGAPPHNLLWSKTGESVGDRFGYSVDGISDLDGDGFGDIVVNAANFNSIRGKVYVYSGNTGVLLWSYLGDTGVSSDGTVSGVHDLDGDGYSDIVVGEPYFSTLSNNWVGRIQVLSGNTGTLLWSENGLSYPENFGRFLSSVIGSNGRGKMIISSPQYIHNGMSLAGRVKVYSGDAAGGNLRWTYEGTHDGELFGRSVSGAPRY